MEGTASIGLLLGPTRGPEARAQEATIQALSSHLAALGHRVDLLASPDAAQAEVLYPGERVRRVRLAAVREPADEDPWAPATEVRDAFLRFMMAEDARYDLLHGSCWLSGWIAVDLGARLDLPAVVSLSSAGALERPPADSARAHMCREVIERASRHIVPNLRARMALVEGHGADRTRVEVIPPGVDIDRFSPFDAHLARQTLGLGSDGFVAAYVGPALEDADGAAVLEAVQHVERRLAVPIAVQLVPGDGENAAWDRQMAYAASDVVIATTWHETAEQRTLEAMACARPVIASTIDETSFALGEGVTGYLVPPREPQELAERLEPLLTQPKLRRRMGQAARIWVEREYSWPMVARRVDAVYGDVLPASAAAASR